MEINNVTVANINKTSNFVPFAKRQTNFPTEFLDSGYEIIPPPTGYNGIGGLKSRMGWLIFPPSDANGLPEFGFKFEANQITGSQCYIGDYSGSYQSTYFYIQQFPNSGLNLLTISDNFTLSTYIYIEPNFAVYGLGNNVSQSGNLTHGFIIDGNSGVGAFYLGQGYGMEFNINSGQFKFGNINASKFLGVDEANSRMIVSTKLIQGSRKYDAEIRVQGETGQNYIIPLQFG